MISVLVFCLCVVTCLSYLMGVFGILTKCQLTSEGPYEVSILLGYDTASLDIRDLTFRNMVKDYPAMWRHIPTERNRELHRRGKKEKKLKTCK